MDNKSSSLEIFAPSTSEAGSPLHIRGKFKVIYSEVGISAKGEELLKHVVLVVTRGANYQAFAPFKDVVVFADDVSATPEGISGFFNFNLFEKIAFGGEGTYFILCSLGKNLSNVVKIEIREAD